MEVITIMALVSIGTSTITEVLQSLLYRAKCRHKNRHTYVESVAVTCEKTTVTCLDCNKKLSTKTDCA